jgi:SAM-dependent methyltransferase
MKKSNLPQRSDERLALRITKEIISELSDIESILDIGCGDGIVGKTVGDKIRYRGIDLSDSFIYKQESSDSRIVYTSLDNVKSTLESEGRFDLIAILDVLEHTRGFSELFELALPHSKRFILVSLPNELFIAERIRMLAGRELRAHSLTLAKHPEGFKHQFIVNIEKARSILKESAREQGFDLVEEWRRPLLAKNKLLQPALWLSRLVFSDQVWSMGSIFLFEKY